MTMGLNGIAGAIGDAPRGHVAGVLPVRFGPAHIQLIEPQRGVRRQRLEVGGVAQRGLHHQIRSHFQQLHLHHFAVGRAQLLGR